MDLIVNQMEVVGVQINVTVTGSASNLAALECSEQNCIP